MPYQANISQVVETDVLVVGGGSAGATAAIAAARQGAKTLLVERYGFLGGISTQVLDTFYGFYTPGTQARKVIGGIPDDIVAALADQGKVIYRPNTYGAGQGITYDPQALKIIWERLAQRAGVRLLYHSFVMDVMTAGERITGVIAATKAGLLQINAKTIIDASGDADVAAAADVPFEFAGEQVQSLTTTFHLINVDVERAAKVSKNDLHERMAQAIGSGRYDLPRREGSVHINPLPGVMVTNMTRVGNIDATDPFQLTQAEIEGRRQAEEYARFLVDWVPGYEHADMGALSHQIGVR
ncbi:MAG: FAD-dependent oxidoreductase, partial [Anaerolineae bacterium]|nr:FAD-dependent oxidoreductase [Anaerolineae bacterium]